MAIIYFVGIFHFHNNKIKQRKTSLHLIISNLYVTEDMFPSTDWPLRRYTPLQFTQPDESNSPLSKSTRHLLVQDPRYYYERGNNIRPVSYTTDPDYKDPDFNESGPGSNVVYHTRGK